MTMTKYEPKKRTRTQRDRMWQIHNAMVRRCTDPRNDSYHLYGGRGISICERWLKSVDAFILDMGPRPSPKHSIDRVNNDGNYEPNNCRWATPIEQQANTRQFRGVRPLARKLGISPFAVRRRMLMGQSLECGSKSPPKISPETSLLIRQMRATGKTQAAIARLLGIAQSAVCRHCKCILMPTQETDHAN